VDVADLNVLERLRKTTKIFSQDTGHHVKFRTRGLPE